MKNGEFDGEELWYRCYHCGDSDKHPDKAHCSVNIYTSLYHCLRCGGSGKMSPLEMGVVTRGLDFNAVTKVNANKSTSNDEMINAITEKIRDGPASERYSGLDRYRMMSDFNGQIDVFKSVDVSQKLLGYHFRYTHAKRCITWGQRALGMSNKIKFDRPWRVVEGPFDCIDPAQDVCVFGSPTQRQLSLLYGQELIICPDGDIWQDRRKLYQFTKPILKDPNLMVICFERIPGGKDPDEVPVSGREVLSVKEVKALVKPKRTFFTPFISPQTVMESIIDNMPEETFWADYS